MKELEELPLHCKVMGPRNKADGAYEIPHHLINEYIFIIVFSDALGWEHLSVSMQKQINNRQRKAVERTPTWAEMCFLKDVFWNPEEAVIQIHPPLSDHISNHNYCLHLWRAKDQVQPLPDSAMVGIKNVEPILKWMKEKWPGQSEKDYYSAIYFSEGDKVDMADPNSLEEFEKKVSKFFESI